MSIFITVVVVSLATVVVLTKNRTRTETNTSVQTSGNLAMEMMVNAVQSATSLSAPSGHSLTIGTKTFSLSGTAITLTTAGVAEPLTSPDVIVESLNFSGAADSTIPAIKGYVTVDMTLKSADPADTQKLTLHTNATYISP